MKLVFEKAKVIVDAEETFLCFAVPYREAKRFLGQMKAKKYVLETKEFRQHRSLDANAYLWALLDKLADKLGSTKEELYLDYVRRYGPFKDFTMTPEEAGTFRHAWQMLGTGWPTEQVDFAADADRVVIRAYYGSSTYNTRQMSRLIQSVADDCKALGIETMTPQELARLTDEWR